MSNITLNIVAPDTPTPTPVDPSIDPSVPSTGLFTHGIGSSEATIIAITSAVLLLTIVAVVVVAILYKKHKAQNKTTKLVHLVDNTKAIITNKKRVTATLTAIALLVSAGTFIALAKNAVNATESDEQTSQAEGVDSSLTVDVSDEELTIEVGNEPVFAVLPVEVSVEEATQAGYTLTAYADSTDLVSTTDSSKVIPMVAAEGDELIVLTTNTYGLSLVEPETKDDEVYTALSTDPSTPTVFKATDYTETEANDTTTIYYGFYITPDTLYGTYTGSTISYEAIPSLATISYDAHGLYYNNDESFTTNIVGYKPSTPDSPIEELTGEYLTPAPLTPVDPSSPIHYTFLGWSEEEGATTPTYTNEEDILAHLTLEPNESITLHAVWHYNTVLSFNGNGGSTTTPMLDRTIPAGTTEPLPANTYTKTGSVFLGWNTVETPTPDNPGRTYEDGAPFTAPEGSQDITLYAQWKVSTLYDKVAAMSKGPQTLAQLQEDITAPTTDDPATDQSNSGVYEYNSSVFGEASDASNTNKIYYYRGILEPDADQGSYGSDGKATTYPNYVRLGNDTCWRIVRTTGSGGVKMIYNGIWDNSSRTCANVQANAQITTQFFNTVSVRGDIMNVGYTYNANYDATDYNGQSVDDVFGSNNNPTVNNTNSTIKTYIEDTWYVNNMSNYTGLLEASAGYCNDRTLYNNDYSQQLSNIDISQSEYFGASYRIGYNSPVKMPSLVCPRNVVDLYHYVASNYSTTNSTANELKYPAALITADEATLAGSGYMDVLAYNSKSYLNTGSWFWTLSPNFKGTNNNTPAVFYMVSGGGMIDYGWYINSQQGVRPAISLKPGTTVASGTGIATDPWIINE